MLIALGSLRRTRASSSGTRMMARFSSRDTVPEFTVRNDSISQDITAKKMKPTSAPHITVRRSSPRATFFPNRASSSAKASRKRTASMVKAGMVSSPILLNINEVLRAMMTDAISTSAFLSDMVFPFFTVFPFQTEHQRACRGSPPPGSRPALPRGRSARNTPGRHCAGRT